MITRYNADRRYRSGTYCEVAIRNATHKNTKRNPTRRELGKGRASELFKSQCGYMRFPQNVFQEQEYSF